MAGRQSSFSVSVHGPLRGARGGAALPLGNSGTRDRQRLFAHRPPTPGSAESLEYDHGGLHDGARDIAVRNLTGDARR
jgi:hypothetical protein